MNKVQADNTGFDNWFTILQKETYNTLPNLPKAYGHYIDKSVITLFGSGVSDISSRSIYLPVPKALQNNVKTPYGLINIDDPYPDSVYTDQVIYDQPTLPPTYSKQCSLNSNDPINNKIQQSSIIFYLKTSSLIGYNSTVEASRSILDSTQKKFLSSKLSSVGDNKYILLEYCYNKEIVFSSKPFEINRQRIPRKIIGNSSLSNFNVFPPKLGLTQQQYVSYSPSPIGSSMTNLLFTQESGLSPSPNSPRQGSIYGEFLILNYDNPLNCKLNNPFLKTDLFGKNIVGVDTALGCLPGSFEGVFTIILRIAVGVSGAILLILILINGLSIIQGGNNAESIKKSTSNISRGIGALIIIVFSVLILNIIGVKILDLSSFGSVGIENILGN